jgi:hypothetical protein
LVFSHQPFLFFLHISFKLLKLILVNLLFKFDLSALFEYLIILVFTFLNLFFVLLFYLDFLVFVFTELGTNLAQIFLQLFDGFFKHGNLIFLDLFMLLKLFEQSDILLFVVTRLFCFLYDLLLHRLERIHQLLNLSFTVKLFVVFSSQQLD